MNFTILNHILTIITGEQNEEMIKIPLKYEVKVVFSLNKDNTSGLGGVLGQLEDIEDNI